MATSAEASPPKQLTALTWNIEGIKNNIFMLTEVLKDDSPDFVFLSEVQIFQCDLSYVAQFIAGEYCYHLNSEDSCDPELPLVQNRAKGGTMLLWRKWLDPFVNVINVNTAAFLPIVFTLPGSRPSVHVALYLPTYGQDTEFVSELASLQNCLDDLLDTYTDPLIFIRGDGNVNHKNTNRVTLLHSFMQKFTLSQTEIPHKTYHHFVGGGKFDSNVDILLHSSEDSNVECVTRILCLKDYPEINSHHDMIMSRFCLPSGEQEPSSSDLVTAPRIEQPRNKIVWSAEGVTKYSALVSNHLKRIRDTWLNPSSSASMSVLLQLTNSIMSQAAIATNDSKMLNSINRKKPAKLPNPIKKAKRQLKKAHKRLKNAHTLCSAKLAFKDAKKNYHRAVRTHRLQEAVQRDEKLFSILGENPSQLFSFIKSCKKTQTKEIASLTVGQKTYHGTAVADGFYDSMTSLKQCSLEQLQADPNISEKLSDYENIIKLCQDQDHTIPTISLEKSTKLLQKIKKNVRDFYSITALHYVNAGQEGLIHYNSMLNGIISDVNNARIQELNTAHGLILYKGHGKDKSSDRAYRTISTCPFLAKSLDLYLRDLYLNLWQDKEADTQYQGAGSSHELASLLITELIQHSLNVSDRPVYLLALDAQSAFDRCLRQILCCELYKASLPPGALLFINNRLASRRTVYEWSGAMMGPAEDDTGFEQGGINSSDFYKLYNNEQLVSAQESKLGVDIASGVISAVGQADDVMLVSNNIDNLRLLVRLTETYCAGYRVKLEPGKTKLFAYSNKDHSIAVEHAKYIHQITICNKPVNFVSEAEHVGVLRSTSGNLPHILKRIAMHKRALYSVLPAGLARGHRGNPAASLKVNQLHATPVLFSGLASLVLSQAEIKIIDSYYHSTLQNLLRLHSRTPRSIVCFLAGSWPGKAILHQRQLSLFAMICHLQGDPLHHHARYVLTFSSTSAKSWFQQVRDLCLQYGLPHPLMLLESPPAKQYWKKLVKTSITEYWQSMLAAESIALTSLMYFNPHMHSIISPHPLWSTAGSNCFEVNKATILAKMISGRYRTENLCRFWSDNRNGYCLAGTCNQVVGDLEHLLVLCPALQHARDGLRLMWLARTENIPQLHGLVCHVLASSVSTQVQFILDPMAFPEIVSLAQVHGSPLLELVFFMTRTYAYSIHRQKMILIGKWPSGRDIPKLDPKSKIYKINQFSLSGSTLAEGPGKTQDGPLLNQIQMERQAFPDRTHIPTIPCMQTPSSLTGGCASLAPAVTSRRLHDRCPAAEGAEGCRGFAGGFACGCVDGLGQIGLGATTSSSQSKVMSVSNADPCLVQPVLV